MTSWIGDGECDARNNHEGCEFDGGDCCQLVQKCYGCYADWCKCHETGSNMCCHSDMDLEYIGDGECDDSLNKGECNYDGGDCCLEDVVTDFCDDCL